MMSPSDEERIVAMVDSFTKTVARNFSRNLKRAKANAEKHYSDEPVDYLTGVMCAIIDKTLSSNVGFKGIFRKVLIFVMVGIGHVIDTQLIGSGDALRTAVIFFYISNEGVSLLENAGHIGLPIPEKLKEVLAQLHNRTEDDKDTEDKE